MGLNDQVDFDSPFRVHSDGTLTHEKGVYGPTLYDERLDSEAWEMLNGYSMQYRYSGPIMHDSECLGGQIERDILDTPGVYVIIAAYWSPEEGEDDDEMTIEGWAICRLKDDEEGN